MRTIEQWREYLARTRPGSTQDELERIAAYCVAIEKAIADGEFPPRPAVEKAA